MLVSWLDDQKQQYQLAMIDAEDGRMLGNDSLVETFTGKVFNASAQPTANPSTDTRIVVSFNGDATASPRGWVDGRTTVGNSAIAATDLNADDVVGANETQPTANTSDSFDFPFDPTRDASNFKAAAVTNAFYLVNDYRDRTYALGFTEAAGNFQQDNLGRAGVQNDGVRVDAQDAIGINNANFATPPDGIAPRMQMFLWNRKNGTAGVDQAPQLDFGLPSPWQPITGDFNGDGRTDYARLGATGAWVFIANANGTFSRGFQSYVDQAPQLDFGLPSSWEPITGDFNGDGKTDYARVGATGAWVFIAGPGGTFSRGFQRYVDQAPALNFGQPSTWTTITGDFNGDGRTDYARLGDTGVWIFFGNANGTFTRSFQAFLPQTFGQPSPWQVVTGKFLGGTKVGFLRLGGTLSYVYNAK